MIENTKPGDKLDLFLIAEEKGISVRNAYLDEFEGLGFVTDSRDQVGEVSLCPTCQGDWKVKGSECLECEGYGTVVDWGYGSQPYRD